jgi:hypothetical protein
LDAKLMTYAEVADALGITVKSARNLARRHRWQRKPGNDGMARVEVPLDYLADKAPPSEGTAKGAAEGAVEGPAKGPVETAEGSVEATAEGSVEGVLSGTLIAAFERHIQRLEQEIEVAKRESALVQAEAAAAPALRDTIAALKGALESDRSLIAELRRERDRLTARRPWWWRRAG